MVKLATQKYSDRLGVLTHDQLQAALDRFDLGALQSAEPATTGLFGQILLLETTRGSYAFRGHPHAVQLEPERFFAQRIHEQTQVPAPWPYRVDPSHDIFGWPYAVMPRLPGHTPQSLWKELDASARRSIAGALGAALAELHTLTGEDYAVWDAERHGLRPVGGPFAAWNLERLHGVIEDCDEVEGALDAEDRAWIEHEIASSSPALEIEPAQPTYVHHDFTGGNVVVQPRDSDWSVTGVFDLQENYFGDPEEDLVRTVGNWMPPDPECGRRFVRAYTARRSLRDGYRERFRFYMLRDRLGLWSYGRRNKVWFPEDARFREFARAYLELDPF